MNPATMAMPASRAPSTSSTILLARRIIGETPSPLVGEGWDGGRRRTIVDEDTRQSLAWSEAHVGASPQWLVRRRPPIQLRLSSLRSLRLRILPPRGGKRSLVA